MSVRSRNSILLIAMTAVMLSPAAASASSLRTLPRHYPFVDAVKADAGDAFLLQRTQKHQQARSVSEGKAVLYSLLLPGMGDYYLGRKDRAKVFFLTEAAIWTSFIVFEVQGYQRKEGYKEFAVTFGGISGMDHSQDYYKLLTQFNSSREYEEFIKREGRYILYPEADRYALDRYYVTNRVSDFEPWGWPSDEVRRKYRGIRKGSRQAYRRALYSVAAGVANRIVSTFFSLKAARDINRSGITSNSGYLFEFGYPRRSIEEPFPLGFIIIRTF